MDPKKPKIGKRAQAQREKDDAAMQKAITTVVKTGEAALPPPISRPDRVSQARISDKQYSAMLKAFREDYTNPANAAKIAKVNVATAEYAWLYGGAGRPPISETLAREAREARASLAVRKSNRLAVNDSIALANTDLADSRVDSARAIRIARKASVSSLEVGATLLDAGIGLSARIEELMNNPSWAPSPTEAVKLLKTIVELSKLSMDAVNSVDQMEARLLNAPPIYVEEDIEIDQDEALEILQQGSRAANLAQNRALRDGKLSADEDDFDDGD